MPKRKKQDSTTANASALARGWEIHFGLDHGAILTREELLARDADLNCWVSAEQEDGFTDERTLPHGLFYLKVDDALKVCLQTGHPDTHDAMIVGWYWDSFNSDEIAEGTFSTPEWDEIEEGESLFDTEDEMHETNGFPCWNSEVYERFESHSRQGYMGFAPSGPAPQHDLMRELDILRKKSLEVADPLNGPLQDIDETKWEIYFGIRRVKRLLSGFTLKKI